MVRPFKSVVARNLAAFHGDIAHPAKHQVQFRLRQQTGHLEGELLLRPLIVGIQESDKLALRQFEAAVTRRGRPGLLLPDVTHRFPQFRRNARAVVFGTVVDDQDFERRVTLAAHAGHRVRQEARRVGGRDDHAHQRVGHGVIRRRRPDSTVPPESPAPPESAPGPCPRAACSRPPTSSAGSVWRPSARAPPEGAWWWWARAPASPAIVAPVPAPCQAARLPPELPRRARETRRLEPPAATHTGTAWPSRGPSGRDSLRWPPDAGTI